MQLYVKFIEAYLGRVLVIDWCLFGGFVGFEYSYMSVGCRYVISSLELLVAEDYMIIYLNGATPRRRMPGISWLKRCYQMIDRRYCCCKVTSWPISKPLGLDGTALSLYKQLSSILLCIKMLLYSIISRLRKNLKCLIIVHPSWFIRTVLAISRPFIR